MNTNATQGNKPTGSGAQFDHDQLVQIVLDLQEQNEEQQETIEKLTNELGRAHDRIDELEEEHDERIEENEQQAIINTSRVNGLNDGLDRIESTVEEIEDNIEDIDREQDVHDSRITAVSDGLERVEGNDGDTNHGGSDEETTLHRTMTPLESLLDDPGSSCIRITPSVDRALKIAGHIDEWSEKVPAGHVVRDGLNKLLSTVTDESLAWKQVHRACHKLDELTKGRISFEETDKHGRVLVLRDEEYLSHVVSAGGGR